MKKPIKYIIIGIVVLASIAGVVFYMMQPIPVRMTEMRLQTAELSFTEQGVVVAENTMLVFSAAQGGLQNMYVREGQRVTAGDLLISVDTTLLELQLAQIESGILGLEAQLANVQVEDRAMRRNLETTRTSLQGELQALNAQAAEASRTVANHQESVNEQLRVQQILIDQHYREIEQVTDNYERTAILYNSGVVAYAEYSTATAAVTAAQARLEAAYAQMSVIATGSVTDSAEHFEGIRASLVAQINGISQQLSGDTTSATRAHFQALIAVEQTSIARIQHEIQNAVVTAPIDGVITTLHAQNTNFITSAAPIAEITVAGDLYIEAYVSTQDVNSISIGDTVRLTLRQRTGDIIFNGTVAEIGDTAVVRFTALGVEERKVNIRLSPQVPTDVTIGIGYGVDVTFYIFREENRITVPRTALFRDNGVDKVWVVDGNDNGTIESRAVTTGMELRTETIIESGLSEGDFVINDANNSDLRNGTRVRAE
ncbi:MAG: efflux RND transporter periplasmic adaptor subunit [Defluviitaleaceae bacterium]|nr:efflux RND transporter periplasmic adaptor subunit [Defluviitaleaceae bacterium]